MEIYRRKSYEMDDKKPNDNVGANCVRPKEIRTITNRPCGCSKKCRGELCSPERNADDYKSSLRLFKKM